MLASQLDDRLTPREREYFPLIQNECDQVSVMVNRMEDLFRPVPAPEPVALESVLVSTMTELRGGYPMAEIHLDLDLEKSDRLVCGTTLRTVLLETVANAFEISRKPITICLSDSGDACLISVADQGEAVSDEVCRMAFEPFYTERTRQLGIGLSMVDRMVSGRGGNASFKTGPDGNVVEIILPYM
jgi:signal transduction histidine kinase